MSRASTLQQRGVSAIFIVIFAAMLFSLIAVSFTGLMVREQSRSNDDEQSQGAYDAALVGVEDGKRVLADCINGANSTACAAIDAEACNTINHAAGNPLDNSETVIRSDTSSTGSGEQLNMAHTCVVVKRDTDAVEKTIPSDTSAIIKLDAVGADFDRVELSWYSEDDIESSGDPLALWSNSGQPLPALGSWQAGSPPLLRVQLIQYEAGSYNAAGDFRDAPYSMTGYLYPHTSGLNLTNPFSFESVRRSGTLAPSQVECVTPGVSGYSCNVTLDVPKPGGWAGDRVAYLRVMPFYGDTSISLKLRDGSGPLLFDDVQPTIDSTGRANDLFRRVLARVEQKSDFPLPRATVDITDNFCKTLFVGYASSGISNNNTGLCNPDSY